MPVSIRFMAAGKVTPSQAKNFIARALQAVADPHPSGVALQGLWKHFNGRCAYCGTALRPGLEQASYDHLNSKEGNHIGNIVLSCGQCNEYEKRDLDWDTFLRAKAGTRELYSKRRARIVAWQRRNRRDRSQVDEALLRQAEDCVQRAVNAFNRELSKLRAARVRSRILRQEE